ncbi:MAG: hypothetical protein AAGA30_09160, partial [Planctomycetota bacterium]
MRETTTNENLAQPDRQSDESIVRGTEPVPKRRGSKYADILLQKLQPTLFSENASPVIGVVSFAPRQGVSTTAINLGIRAADHHYAPAIAIDANYRNQKLSRIYRCSGSGLSDCLNGQADLENSVYKTKIPGFFTMGAGETKLSKQILFDPEIGREFFKLLRNDFRLSIIDFAAFDEPSVTDSILPCLDGVIVVARYGTRK